MRIFHGAPRGTSVYEIKLDKLIDVTQTRLVRLRLAGADHHHFRLSSNTLKINEYPRLSREIDEKYHVDIELAGVDEPGTILAIQKLDIVVSQKNLLAPYFPSDTYKAEVFRHTPKGTRILQVEVKDDDEVVYNKEVVYSVSQGYKAPIQISPKGGVITSLNELRNAPSVLTASITATNLGSPQLSNRTNVTIAIREISGRINSVLDITTCITLLLQFHIYIYIREFGHIQLTAL